MATVYLAHDSRHDRKVAIKVLRPELAATVGPQRFLQEIQIAARLTHPHILPLHDSGVAGEFLFYVMPYVEGESLRDKLAREGELPVTESVRILKEVTDALAYAHEHGVVHRDIKPENVMLSGRHALVTDFGVAKALHEATGRQRLTTVGVALGTPAYMAPEQAAADPHIDHRADIYSVGVLGYELLTGRPPFTGLSPQMVLAAHVTEQPRPVTDHRAAVPPAMAGTIMRCLEKKPADRWQTAAELLTQFEVLAATPSGGITPTTTRPITAVSAPVESRQSRRLWITALVAVVGVLGAAGVWRLLVSRPKPLDPGRVLVVPFEVTAGSGAIGALPQLLESSVAQGIGRTGLATAVGSRTAIAEASWRDTSTAAIANATGARKLAQAAGAGLLVTGRILLLGDSVQVEATLVNVETGGEVVPVPPIKGALAAASILTESVTQRIMGALSMYKDPRFGSSLPGTRAPTYAAFREFQEGTDHWNRSEMAEAAARYLHAYQLDSTMLVAAVRYGYARYNAGDCAGVDSLGRELEPRRPNLSPYETQYLNRLLAWCRGDYNTALTAAREMARIAPKSMVARYTAARSAIFVNRLEEARDGLLKVDPTYPDLNAVDFYFNDLAEVYHLLGDSKAELETARRWAAHPGTLQPMSARSAEAHALVSAGMLDQAEALFPQFLTTRTEGRTRPVRYALDLLAELRWHGHRVVATRLAASALERMGGTLGPVERAGFLELAGRLDAAAAIIDSLRRALPQDLFLTERGGVLAAARGDSASARAVLAQLEKSIQPYDNGETTTWRACILAQLGEKDRAVNLLQQALGEGIGFAFVPGSIHGRTPLEPLRGFPPFEALIKPK